MKRLIAFIVALASSMPALSQTRSLVATPNGTSGILTWPSGTLTIPNGAALSIGAAGVKITDDNDGAITFLGLGNGSDEDLTLNLDDTSNTGVFTSSTGLNVVNFSSIALQESGVGVVNVEEIDTSAELRGLLTDESGSGALLFAGGAGGAFTVTTLNGVTITGSGTLNLAAGSSLVTSGANSITLTSTGPTNVTLPTSGTLYGSTTNTITSNQLYTSLTDETGVGAAVFASSPTLTTPKFADLGYIADTSSNELLIFDSNASAVNELTINNATTGLAPGFTATGGDTNIGIGLVPKGSGTVTVTAANGAYALALSDGSITCKFFIGSDGTTNGIGYGTTSAHPLAFFVNNGLFSWKLESVSSVVWFSAVSASGGGGVRVADGTAALPSFSFSGDTDLGIRRNGADDIGIYTGSSVQMLGLSAASGISTQKTITAGGTTGAQTINKPAGSVNFAAASSSLVVTNSLVTANSVIICTVATNDTTMKSVAVVAAAGSFTLHANAAATAETRVNFIVIN